MRFVKSLIILLVFVMASGPALASACAAKCAMQPHGHTKNVANENSMAGMVHCHESVTAQSSEMAKQSAIKRTDNSKHGHPQHPGCAMGALCGFGQMATFSIVSKLVLAESSIQVFPKVNTTEKSIDLSPPLKPPA